jgi:hypothetical protein
MGAAATGVAAGGVDAALWLGGTGGGCTAAGDATTLLCFADGARGAAGEEGRCFRFVAFWPTTLPQSTQTE